MRMSVLKKDKKISIFVMLVLVFMTSSFNFAEGQNKNKQTNQQSNIPLALVGDWMTLPEANAPICKLKDIEEIENSQRYMIVKSKAYSRHEVGCSPVRITNNHPYYTLKMQCGGDGEIWNEEQNWELTKILDRNVLIVSSFRNIKGSPYLTSAVFEKCLP